VSDSPTTHPEDNEEHDDDKQYDDDNDKHCNTHTHTHVLRLTDSSFVVLHLTTRLYSYAFCTLHYTGHFSAMIFQQCRL